MNTRIFSRTVLLGSQRFFATSNSTARLFREHIRLVFGGLVMAIVITAIIAPSSVQSGSPAFLNAPTLSVTATSNTSISLSWSVPVGANQYAIERANSMSGPFNNINVVAGTTYTDTTLTSQKAYVYRVRAIDTANSVSDPSNMAVGTAISFEFSHLLGQTIRARHLHDVRAAVNAFRRVAHLPEITFLQRT